MIAQSVALSPALCALVLAGFAGARWLSARVGHPPWASPVLVTALAVIGVLAVTGLPLATFTAATAPLRWLLGAALVALATVIDANRAVLRVNGRAVVVAAVGGALTGLATAVAAARLLGIDGVVAAALVTKSVTTPFTVAIMAHVGGPVALAAAFSVVTGVVGALLVPPVLAALGLGERVGAALALGVSSHIVGTDWLVRRDAGAAGFAALAFVVVGVVAAIAVPLLWRLLA